MASIDGACGHTRPSANPALRVAGVNLAQRTLDAKGVFTSIADGRERNGIRMPEWRGVLSDKQIWEATAYVLSISQQWVIMKRMGVSA